MVNRVVLSGPSSNCDLLTFRRVAYVFDVFVLVVYDQHDKRNDEIHCKSSNGDPVGFFEVVLFVYSEKTTSYSHSQQAQGDLCVYKLA